MGRLGHSRGDAVAADSRLSHVIGEPSDLSRRLASGLRLQDANPE
jgi:hypothetical protein